MSDRSIEVQLAELQENVKYIKERIDGVIAKTDEHDQRIRGVELKLASFSGKEQGITSTQERNERRFKLTITALILVTSAINILIALFH